MANDQDNFQDLKDQFKDMHDALDKLAPAVQEQAKVTEEVVKEAKEEKKEKKQQTKKTEKLATDEAKDRKSILKAMQMQLRKTQMEQGASMADVAAEHLASGGGLAGAAKAAVGLKVGQFKHKFDPLNLIKKITGGSKLAVALAGKVMGRSEKSVRSFADLAPGMDLPTPFFGKGKGFGSPSLFGEGKGGRHNIDGGSVLTQISRTLSQMLVRLTNIETIERLSAKLTQEQVDAQRDAEAEAKAKISPTKFGAFKEKLKEGENFFEKLFKSFKLPLLAAIGLLAVAGYMLYKQWNNLKLSFGLLKDSAVEMWEGVKNAFSSAGTWISDVALKITDTIKGIFESIVDTVQDVLYSVTFGKLGKKSPSAQEKQVDLEKRASEGEGYAQRKIAAQNIEKEAAPGEAAAAVNKHVSSFTGKIPAESKLSAAESLKRGDYDAAAVGALMGTTPISGTSEQKAATGAVTQLVAKSYGEVFKDGEGNPLTPSKDTPENRATRLPVMVREASRSLAQNLETVTAPTQVAEPSTITPSSVGTSPTELPMPIPMTGMSLNQAAENQRNSEVAGKTGAAGVAATVINNVKNNNSSVTNVHQNMPDPRSGETSYLRAQDAAFARY